MTSKGAIQVDAALDVRPWLHGTSSGPWPARVELDGLGAIDFSEVVDPGDQVTLRDAVRAALASGREVSVEYLRAGHEDRWMVEELRPMPAGYATLVRRAGEAALIDASRGCVLAVVAHDLANLRFLLRATADAAKGGAAPQDVHGDVAHVVDRSRDVTGTLMVFAGGRVEPTPVALGSLPREITRMARQIFEDREIIVTTTGPGVTRNIERPRLVALLAALLARGLRRPRATEDVRVTLRTEAPDRFELSIEHSSDAPFEPTGPLSERGVITQAKALGLVVQLDRDGARVEAR